MLNINISELPIQIYPVVRLHTCLLIIFCSCTYSQAQVYRGGSDDGSGLSSHRQGLLQWTGTFNAGTDDGSGFNSHKQQIAISSCPSLGGEAGGSDFSFSKQENFVITGLFDGGIDDGYAISAHKQEIPSIIGPFDGGTHAGHAMSESPIFVIGCMDSLDVYGTIITSDTLKAGQLLRSTATISNGNFIEFNAPTVELLPGFDLSLGSTLYILQVGCASMNSARRRQD